MGLFDFVESVAKIVVRTAVLPVAVVKDVVTMGGTLTDEKSAIVKNVSKTIDDVEKLPDTIDK